MVETIMSNPEEAMLEPIETILFSDEFSLSEMIISTIRNDDDDDEVKNDSSENCHEVDLEQSSNSFSVEQHNFSQDINPPVSYQGKEKKTQLTILSQKQFVQNIMASGSHDSQPKDTCSLPFQTILSDDDIIREELLETIDSIRTLNISEDIDKNDVLYRTMTKEHPFMPAHMYSKDSIDWETLESLDQQQKERVTETEKSSLLFDPSIYERHTNKNNAEYEMQNLSTIQAPVLAFVDLQDKDAGEEGSNYKINFIPSCIEEKVARHKLKLKSIEPKNSVEDNSDPDESFNIAGLVPESDIQKSVISFAQKEKSKAYKMKNTKRKILKEPPIKMYFEKRDVDVIFGRGSGPNIHNKSFRAYVAQFQDDYLTGNALAKNRIVQSLIQWVNDKGGRFLDKDEKGWYEVSAKAVQIKVRQLVREMGTKAQK
jgi:hypothetical protein